MGAVSLKNRISASSSTEQPLLISGSAWVFFALLALMPVAVMLGRSVFVDGRMSLLHYRGVFSEPRVYYLLGRSLLMASGATLLSLCCAVPPALFLSRSRFYGSRLYSSMFLVPLFIPSHIHALGWLYFLGDKGKVTLVLMQLLNTAVPPFTLYNWGGAIFLLCSSYYPLLALMVMVGLSRIHPGLEEAALCSKPPFKVLRSITLPLVYPYILTGAVLVFILSFFNYGIPSMLRVNSFPVEIFTRFSAYYDEGGAAALSLPVILVAAVLLRYRQRVMGRKTYTTVTASSGGQPSALFHPGPGGFFSIILLLITVGIPLLGLILQAGSFRAYATVFNTSSTELVTTVVMAGLSATLTSLLAYLLARHTLTTGSRVGQVLEGFTYLPLAFPATFFGIGFIYTWNNPWSQWLYASWPVLVMVYIARFIPFGVGILNATLRQNSPGAGEAAWLCEPSWLKRMYRIHLPLARRGLLLCWVIVFVFSMGELGATLLVIPPGMGTVSLKIYTLMHYGAGPLVAALGLVFLAVNLAVSLCALGLVRQGEV